MGITEDIDNLTMESGDVSLNPTSSSISENGDSDEIKVPSNVKGDSLSFNVLTSVTQENYDRAIKEINNFLEKDWEYPDFIQRIERYANHSIDLINAIRAKKKVAGASMLTMSKQQDLHERYKKHYKELEYTLKKIEKTYKDLKHDDVRSTVLILRALVNASLLILCVAFVIEMGKGLMANIFIVFDSYFTEWTDMIFGLLGL